MTQEHHDHEGKSVASWTGVGICLVASVLIAVGMMLNMHWLAIVGGVLVVVGAIAGKALTAAGFGAEPMPRPQSPEKRSADSARA